MQLESKIKSIFKFNQRVLAEGNIKNQLYSLKELEQKLFFNKVFMSNSNEIFEKYFLKNSSLIKNYYQSNLPFIRRNVDLILKQLKENYGIIISNKGIVLKDTSSINIGLKINELKNNQVYFMTVTESKEFIISEQIKEIKPFFINNKFIRSDLAIIETLNNLFNGKTYEFKITNSVINGLFIKFEVSSWYNDILGTLKEPFSKFVNPYLNLEPIFDILKIFIKKTNNQIKKKLIGINDIFKSDQILFIPDDSFDNYLNVLSESINHPNCVSIFMTIYRIGKSDKILNLLTKAIKNGINVTVVIELKAYGEKINYEWQKKFRKAGIKVINSQKNNFKVHAKVTLIEFSNRKNIIQIGTGNYNEITSKSYTDLMFFSSNPKIINDSKKLIRFFNGTYEIGLFESKNLLITQLNFRKVFYKLIQDEIKKGSNGYLGFKCNGLGDPQVFELLEKAQMAGVKIDLIVRGVCTWIPKSFKNLQIKSVIWDKLEHSRIYIFGNDKPVIYIGSLDMISHKINERIETLIKIKDPLIKKELINYMEWYINDKKYSWKMIPGGDYVKIS